MLFRNGIHYEGIGILLKMSGLTSTSFLNIESCAAQPTQQSMSTYPTLRQTQGRQRETFRVEHFFAIELAVEPVETLSNTGFTFSLLPNRSHACADGSFLSVQKRLQLGK